MQILSHRGEVGRSLWLCWVAATFAGASAGWFLTWVDPFLFRFAFSLDSSFLVPNVVLAGIVVAQWLVLRWWFSRSAWWVLASVLGIFLFSRLSFSPFNIIGIVVVGIGVGVGIWQRPRVKQIASQLAHQQTRGWVLLWVIVSVVGFAAQAIAQLGLFIVTSWLYYADESNPFFALIVAVISPYLASLLFGIVTGAALIWLLRLPPPEGYSPNQDSQIMPE